MEFEEDCKRPRDEASVYSELYTKFVTARAGPGIVSIVSHDVPVEMCKSFRGYFKVVSPPPKEVFFFGCGLILECQSSAEGSYLCTVLAPACLFQRPTNVNLTKIKIDVFASTGVLYKGKLLAWDFHYNLALIGIKSTSPLPTVTLKRIDEVLSIDPTKHFQSRMTTSHLRPHSNSFKIVPGTEIISACRSFIPPYTLYPDYGYYSSSCPDGLSCNELYGIKNITYRGLDGGPVLSSLGEVIGIVFYKSSFLPSNIVTRWWNHYKSSGKFRRPFLGVEIANLHDADLDFLEQFITRFPNISTGVIVTKVEKDSPACCTGICTKDVIWTLDGRLVQSKLQFFETIWEKAGESVEFNIARVTDGKKLNLNLVIEETSPDKFHQWPHPGWNRRW